VWQRSVDLIEKCKKIVIISGFYIPSVMAPETDGVAGSCVLGRALREIGLDVEIWTDSLCVDVFKACASAVNFPCDRLLDVSGGTGAARSADLFIYIERVGRAEDGAYYNMRSVDISRWTEPLDEYALLSSPVIGIGDGGNEVGMGSLNAALSELMPDYSRRLCILTSDICIPVDVSNWGAYALTAAISLSRGEWLGQSEAEETGMMDALLECGAVDGVTGRRERSVDGLSADVHLNIRSKLEALVNLVD
jgi:hypothetical protein